MSILIKRVLLGEKEVDIYIEGNIIEEIGEDIKKSGEFVIEGKNKAAIPGLLNAHTHAAMTLFRGYADDMALQEWLQTKIWPIEAKMKRKNAYWGVKLACLEMIKSGTTFFNDMYWFCGSTAKAVKEMGIRAMLSAVFVDLFDEERAKEQIKKNEELFKNAKKIYRSSSGRILFSLGPHSIYTVSKDSLCWVKDFAAEKDTLIHVHLSETKQEVEDCIRRYGMRPVEFLEDIGFLSERTIACHCVHLSKKEIEILKKRDVKIAYNPTSNMKLASGRIPYNEMKEAGLTSNIILGTDGCASNNNLDMMEEMKMAALLQKIFCNDPTILLTEEVFNMGTINACRAFRLNSGIIEEGNLADIVLLNLKKPEMIPNYNVTSNIVYSANGSCVDTVICDGKILMENRKVEGEEEIMEKAKEAAFELSEK